jgi:hypothetical protein
VGKFGTIIRRSFGWGRILIDYPVVIDLFRLAESSQHLEGIHMTRRKTATGIAGLAMALLLAACGGGGGDFQGPTNAISKVGAYAGPAGTSSGATVMIGGDGRVIGSTFANATPASSTARRADFSGPATFNADGSWLIPNARIATVTSSPGTPTQTRTIVGTVSGTIIGGVSVQVQFPFSLHIDGVPDTFGASYTPVQPATPGALAGHYVNVVSTFPSTQSDFTIDASGRLTGLVLPGCNATGMLAVIEADRNLYSGTLSFTGSLCPQGVGADVPVLGAMDGGSLKIEFVDASGVVWVVAGVRQ